MSILHIATYVTSRIAHNYIKTLQVKPGGIRVRVEVLALALIEFGKKNYLVSVHARRPSIVDRAVREGTT